MHPKEGRLDQYPGADPGFIDRGFKLSKVVRFVNFSSLFFNFSDFFCKFSMKLK